jgi:amidase
VVGGEFSAESLLEASLERIAERDGELGAVCWLAPDVGREAARAIDRELSPLRRDPEGLRALLARRPFAGVPFLLKDLGTPAVGLPSRMGSRLFGELTGGPIHWPADGQLVRRYRAAGFVPIGRSASPELGINASTETRAYGRPTRNPWDPQRSAGGSSGGAGAAVAGGLVPIAHASDGAGSIRIPASCCGLVGLKPSRDLMPAGPTMGEVWAGLATEHVLARSVRDSALALAVTAGADAGAPHPAPVIRRDLLERLARVGVAEAVAEPVAEGGRLRIGFFDGRFDGSPIDAGIAEAVRAAARLLETLGHRVEPAHLPVAAEDVMEPVVRVMTCWAAAGIEAFCRNHGLDPARLPEDALEPGTWGALRAGQSLSAPGYIECLARFNQVARTAAEALGAFDVVLTPTLAEPPAVLGRFAMDNPDFLDYRLGPRGVIHYSPFTALANVTGHPAVSLPLATVDGLPVGLQLIGKMGGDAELLALGATLVSRMGPARVQADAQG